MMNEIINIGVGTDVKLTARLVDAQGNAINLNQVTELRAVIYNGDRQRTLSDYNIVDDTSVEFVLRSGTELTAGDQVAISMAIRYKKEGFVNSTPIIEIIHRGWVGEEITPMAMPMAVVNSAITAQFTISVPPAVYYAGASPRIGANGHWFVFDDVTKDYVDTGFGANLSNEQIIADETERRRQEAIRVASETQREVRMREVENKVNDVGRNLGYLSESMDMRIAPTPDGVEVKGTDDGDLEVKLSLSTKNPRPKFVRNGVIKELALKEDVDTVSKNMSDMLYTGRDASTDSNFVFVKTAKNSAGKSAKLGVNTSGSASVEVMEDGKQNKVYELPNKSYVDAEIKKVADKSAQLEQELNVSSFVRKHGYAAQSNLLTGSLSDGYLSYDGSISPATTYVHTDFIAIRPTSEYTVKGYFTSGAVHLIYDSNKSKIATIAGDQNGSFSKTFTSHTNAAYIRCSCRKTELSTFAIVPTAEYDNIATKDDLINTKNELNSLSSDFIKKQSGDIEMAKLSNTIYAKSGINIASGYDLTIGYINNKDEIVIAESWKYSDYIPVFPNAQLRYKGYITDTAVINIYDKNKLKIKSVYGVSGLSGGTKEITIDGVSEACYIRLSVGLKEIDSLSLFYTEDIDTTARKEDVENLNQNILAVEKSIETYPNVFDKTFNITSSVSKNQAILSDSVTWVSGYWKVNGQPEDYDTLWRRTSEMQPIVGGASIVMNQSVGSGNPKILTYSPQGTLIGTITLEKDIPYKLNSNVAFINVSYLSSTDSTFSFVFKYAESFSKIETKNPNVDFIQTNFKSKNSKIELVSGVLGGNSSLYKIKPNITNKKFRLFVRYSIDFDCNKTSGTHPVVTFVNGDKKCSFNLYSEQSSQVVQTNWVEGQKIDTIHPIIACKSGFGYTALGAERKCFARELPRYQDIRGIDLASLRLKITGDIDTVENQSLLAQYSGAKLTITDNSVLITKNAVSLFSFTYDNETNIGKLLDAINATNIWEGKSLGYKNILLKDISKCSEISLINNYRKEFFNSVAGERLDCYPFYFSKAVSEKLYDIEIVCDCENLCAVFDGQNDMSFNTAVNTTLKNFIPYIDDQLEIYIGGEHGKVFNGTIKDIRVDINTTADAEIYKNYRIISNYNKALSIMMGHGMWNGEEVNGKIPAFVDKTNLAENEVACIPIEWKGKINAALPDIAMSTERMQKIATRASQAGWCNINPNRIKDFFLPNNDLPKKSWCIIFDDQEWYIYTDYRLREVFERNGIRANFAISSTSLVTPEVQRQFVLMQREGYVPLIHGTKDEKISDMSSSTMYGGDSVEHSIRSVTLDAKEHDIISNIWVYSNGLQTPVGLQAMSHQGVGIGIMTNTGQNYYVCRASHPLFLHRWNVSDKNDFQELLEQGLI